MALEILDGPLMSFGGFEGFECSKISSLAGSGIFLAGVKPVLAGRQFPNHLERLVFACTTTGLWQVAYGVWSDL